MKRNWNIQKIEESKIPEVDRKMFTEHGGGEGYVDFYEERQDFIIRRDPATFEKVNRVWQFEYLCRHGLKPGDRVLDYGCGPAAAGVYFIEYLDAGKWVGVDISNESIKVGNDLIRRKGLESKRAELIYTPKGDLALLAGRVFDVMIAQSVFTHLPPDEIIAILQRLRPFFAPRGFLYASFSCCPQGIVQQQLHNWYYDHDFIRLAAGEAGLALDILPDWQHPYQCNMPEFAKSTMARFLLA
jgi:ubiquinone/menaquinone biosynthesis C-methylase UbiE